MTAKRARPKRWWTTHFALPTIALAFAAVLLGRSEFDCASLEPFYDATTRSFPLRRGWFFEDVLHIGGKWTVVSCTAAFIVTALLGWRSPKFGLLARRSAYLVTCLLVTVALTGTWKKLAGQVTPWDTLVFGGTKPWPGTTADGSWWAWIGSPGAHASSGFAWMSLYFVGASLGVRHRWPWLAPGVMLGLLFALGQHARGAHQPSHELWSIAAAWFTACIVAAVFRFFGLLDWKEAPDDLADEHAQDTALPWVVGSSVALGGLAYFAADQISSVLGERYPLWHEIFLVSEVGFMTIGLGTTAWLIADKLIAIRARAAQRVDQEREERLRVLGRMAASVAHEVRNPLHTLRLIVDEQRRELPGLRDHALQAEFEASLERIDRAVDLVYRLARPESGEADICDLAQATRDSVVAISRVSSRGIRFEWEREPPRALVASSWSALRIVLDNLLRNAFEASPEGSMVLLQLKSDDAHWTLCIQNRGGLKSSPRHPRESGLGLGVPISRQIATNAGGGIDLAEANGLVTCTLRWPRPHGFIA